VTIEAGQSISHYRLIDKIGEGGMGIVWKALDPSLQRDVAIKFLPEGLVGDAECLARLEREAKLLASLSHPGIATVYGLHEHEGLRFIAMELVPGETLAERLERGVPPQDEALELARQVADALEAAHERGVIHRDLKPANIRVTADGTAKVLDFGLAKSLVQPVAGEASTSPTVTSGGTVAGAILGTAAYMSPEQARGKPLDRRTDIWSFGCVLYEMLTGKRCFDGETMSDTLARILVHEPEWGSLPRGTPASIRGLLRRCLDKDPRRRLRDVGEARVVIEEHQTGAAAKTEPVPRRTRSSVLPWTIAVVMTLCAAVLGWIVRQPPRDPAREPVRLAVSLPQDQRLALADATSLAISPDGSRVIYGASSPPGSPQRLYLRKLDRFEAVPIPGTDGASGPFFSPDGRWFGYFAEGSLYKMAVEGGTPVEVCHVGQAVPGAAWGPDDAIVFTDSPESGLLRVPAAGGTPEAVTTPAYSAGEIGHGLPQLLPGGEDMLFTVSGVDGTSIAVLSLETGTWRVVGKGMGGARYVSSGHLLYGRYQGLVAVAFDPVTMRTTGEPIVVHDDVYTIPALKGYGLAAFAVSDTGVLVYLAGGAEAGENRLVWVDRDGNTRPAFAESGGYEWPRLSPDERKVAVTNRTLDGEVDVWVLDLKRNARSLLTVDGRSILPTWTPDGERIAFASNLGGAGLTNVFWRAADASGETSRLVESSDPRFPRSFTSDGALLAITEWNPETMRDIWILEMTGSREARPIIRTASDEFAPVFSPDDRWLAYVSDESGRYEVYVEPYPRGRGRWLISAGGGTEPVWSADGTELYYRSGDKMMAVPIRSRPEFDAGAPRVLFEKALKSGVYDSLSYDVTADGREFLMIERQLHLVPNRLNVVLHWDQELRRKVPTTTD
jgi:serine/threonine-protein kinase